MRELGFEDLRSIRYTLYAIRLIVLAIALFLILIPDQVSARSFYVDFNNGNDLNSGTSTTQPWKRCPGDQLYAGRSRLRAGDTVYFRRGTSYQGMIKTSSPRITYTVTGWGSGNAVIDGGASDACFHVSHNSITITGGPGRHLILVGKAIRHAAIWNWADDGLSGSVFTNLKIVGIGNASSVEGIGIKIGGNSAPYVDYRISDNIISDCYSAAIKISGNGTHNIEIDRNVLEGNGALPGERCQVNLSSNDGQGVQAVRFHDNTVKNGGSKANGINCNNANNEIYNNTITGNPGHGISLTMNYNKNYSGITKVFSNTISDNAGGYGIIVGSSDASRHVLIYNNVLTNNGWYDLNFAEGSRHNHVYNNTIHHNKPGHGVRVQRGCDNNLLKNNVIWTSGGYAIHDSTGSLQEDFNTLYRASGNATVVWKDRIYNSIKTYREESGGQGIHSFWDDPLFADTITLRLAQRSPCIGNGINLSSLFCLDKEGGVRPKSGGWDRGAYQGRGQKSEVRKSFPTSDF